MLFIFNLCFLAQAEEIINFPFISLNTNNGNVISYFDNTIIDNPLSIEAIKIFNDNIVYDFRHTYNLYGRENTVNFYVMVFDFNKTATNNENIRLGDIIGTGNEPKLIIFSETLNPYLVVNCIRMPKYYDGFYWFDGMFLLQSGSTDWFSFERVQSIEYILNEIIEIHQGISYFSTFRYSFMGKLNEYPREIISDERDAISAFENMFFNRNIITHINEVRIGQNKIYLCWQNGFEQYIQNEYNLNNNIWFFSMNLIYNSYEKTSYIFLRDFKLETLEEMYENRIYMINAER